MQRLSDQRGSAAVIVLVSFTLLFGVGALVVDTGALYQERRVLQNGTDAAALAIAAQCGIDECGSPSSTADDYVDENADDGESTVEEICGAGVTGASACADAPTLPTGAEYVRVTAKTAEGTGDVLPTLFARVFDVEGTTVRAQSTVAWGGPSSFTAELPLTISQCEFDELTDEGAELHDPPPYTTGFPSPEANIVFHNGNNASGTCPAGPAGSDLPGGFGWLDTSGTDCRATSDTEGWFDDKTGRPPPTDCDVSEMAALVGTIVHLPIFDQTNGLSGSNGEYHMSGFASFYLTGYSIQGQYREESLVTGSYPCSGDVSCITGFFVQDERPLEGEIGGPAMGVLVIDLIS